MTVAQDVISRPIYRVLQKMTHETRIDVALSIAVKELIRLRLKETAEQRSFFEAKYGMPFETFRARFEAEEIPNQYAYRVENDYRAWESAVTDEESLRELEGTLL